MRHTSCARAGASGCFDDGRRLRGVSEALPLSRSPEDLLRSEPLDQDHRATAAWTEPKNRRTIQQCCLPVSLTPSAPLILAFSELTISGYPAYTCPYPTLQVRGFPPPSHGLGSGWFA